MISRIQFLVFMLFCCFSIFGQQYTFTSAVKYSQYFNGRYSERVCYTNEDDSAYSLLIISKSAILFDYKKKRKHIFKVTQKTAGDSNKYELKLVKTMDLFYQKNNEYSKYKYEFQTISVKDTITTARLNIFENNKKKEPIMYLDFEYKKCENDFFVSFRNCCIHPFESQEKLIMPNALILNAKGKTISGLYIEHKLIEQKSISYEVIVPD